MDKDFEAVRKELPLQSFASDITCFIVFGSSVVNYNMGKAHDDVDVCVVVNDRSADLDQVSNYIFDSFKKPDFRIYFKDEVDSNLPFMDKGVGVFAAEYFANGVSLFGENVFIEKLNQISKIKMKEAYLNKIFEYIIRIREVYISRISSDEYRMWHTFKYVIRLSIDILLYENRIVYSDLKKLSKHDIVNLCKKYSIIRNETKVDFDDLKNLYELFKEINLYIVNCHTGGAVDKSKNNRA